MLELKCLDENDIARVEVNDYNQSIRAFRAAASYGFGRTYILLITTCKKLVDIVGKKRDDEDGDAWFSHNSHALEQSVVFLLQRAATIEDKITELESTEENEEKKEFFFDSKQFLSDMLSDLREANRSQHIITYIHDDPHYQIPQPSPSQIKEDMEKKAKEDDHSCCCCTLF